MRLAVFDLDGTITRHDTLWPFVLGRLRSGRPWALGRLFGVLPGLLRFAFDRDRGKLKQALIRATLRGERRSELERWADEFARDTVKNHLHVEARTAIEQHLRAGDRLILMSASVDLYVPRIGACLGFHETICTGVQWNGDVLDGALTTANRRGEEKARCLRDLARRYPGTHITAYGNTGSDLPHLRLAHQGVFVNAPPLARPLIERSGIRCERWR
jgi:HAD superfamily hydrolase (TIGR01490 family)